MTCTDTRQYENLPELEHVPISDNMLLDDVKAHILDKLIAAGKAPLETVPRQLRLRTWLQNRADVFLNNNARSVGECGVQLFEGRQLCVQILDEPENISLDSGNDVVVLVQRWHRSTWTLGECREVCLQNDMTLRNIAAGLGEMMSIEPQNIRVLVVRCHLDVRLRYLHMDSPKYSSESWLDPCSEPPTRTLQQAKRLFYSDLLLIQDVTEPLYELTPSDKLSMQLVDLAENSYGTGRSYHHSYDGYDNLYSVSKQYDYNNNNNGSTVPPLLLSPTKTRSAGGIKIKIHSRQLSATDESKEISSSSSSNGIKDDDVEGGGYDATSNNKNRVNPLFNDSDSY